MAEKESPSPSTAVEAKEKEQQAKPARCPEPGKLPPYNVVLLDDDEHSFEYVIQMLGAIFGYDEQKAFKMATEVNEQGRVIVLTTHKEKAELKRDQITAYGADALIAGCKGSMSSIVEPAN
jgi:ATP-dependent Clp protease adaptor protein ClpS